MRPVLGLALLVVATASWAQDVPTGQVARSPVGQAGQRQVTRGAGAEPLARLDTRIANRVQSRIRNRIDSDYDPQADATSPFEVADEEARAPERLTRR